MKWWGSTGSAGEEPALDRGQGDRAVDRLVPAVHHGAARGRGNVGGGGQLGYGLVLEHLARGQPQAGLVGPRHDLDAEDRIAAQGEEIVVDAHLLQPQDLGPDARQDHLGRRPGGHRRCREPGALAVGRGKSGPIHLAVDGERQGAGGVMNTDGIKGIGQAFPAREARAARRGRAARSRAARSTPPGGGPRRGHPRGPGAPPRPRPPLQEWRRRAASTSPGSIRTPRILT